MKDWGTWRNRVIVDGKGFYLVDSEGRTYLDGIASMWCNVWGHGQNEVTDAMKKQIEKVAHSTLFGLANEPSTLLAEKLVELAKGMRRVFYSDNGSTAIEASMKMAIQYWKNKGKSQKQQFVALKGGYHGDTIGCMSIGYIDRFFEAYSPLLSKARVHRAPTPLLYKSGGRDENRVVDSCLERTEQILKRYHDKIAALVMESGAQIAGGVVIYPDGYQKRISELCKKYDVLLIIDEIATGFGRLGNMVEYLAQKSNPDIVCLGKALTGGYFPLAATLATERIFDAFLAEYHENKQFYHGHTFTGHPIGCAAALANLELYKKENLMRRIAANHEYIRSRLKEFENNPIVADIRHKGMLAGIELALNGKPIEVLRDRTRLNYFVMTKSLDMGVFLRPLGNIMLMIPPLAIGREELQKIIDVQLKLLGKIQTKLGKTNRVQR